MMLRIFAGLIDGLQFLFFAAFLALQFMTPVGGAVGGAVAGASFCWSTSTGILQGIFDAAKCALAGGVLGGVLSTFAIPLGMVVDVVISISLGGALLLFLASRGMFYPQVIIPSMLGEVLPVFAFLPFWSYLVHASIKRQKQGAHGGLLSAALGAAVGGSAGQTIAGALSAQRYGAQAQAPRRFADITPPQAANDNEPQSYAKAA